MNITGDCMVINTMTTFASSVLEDHAGGNSGDSVLFIKVAYCQFSLFRNVLKKNNILNHVLSWTFKCIVYTNKDVLSSERDFCPLVFRVLIIDGKFIWFAQNLRVVFCCGSRVDQLCRTISTHWGRDKMAANSWRHFQMHFLEWKYVNFDYDVTEVCSQWSN